MPTNPAAASAERYSKPNRSPGRITALSAEARGEGHVALNATKTEDYEWIEGIFDTASLVSDQTRTEIRRQRRKGILPPAPIRPIEELP